MHESDGPHAWEGRPACVGATSCMLAVQLPYTRQALVARQRGMQACEGRRSCNTSKSCTLRRALAGCPALLQCWMKTARILPGKAFPSRRQSLAAALKSDVTPTPVDMSACRRPDSRAHPGMPCVQSTSTHATVNSRAACQSPLCDNVCTTPS